MSFDDIFKNSGLPQDPSFYIHVPSKIDPSTVPEKGKEAVTVLVPISCIKPGKIQDWDRLADYARKYIFNVFRTKFGVDLRNHIISERINTPLTWRDKFNLYNGSALGLSHSITHDKFENLFFVGKPCCFFTFGLLFYFVSTSAFQVLRCTLAQACRLCLAEQH